MWIHLISVSLFVIALKRLFHRSKVTFTHRKAPLKARKTKQMKAAGFPKEVSSIWWLFLDVIDCSPCLCETFLAGGDALCVRDPDRMGLGWVGGWGVILSVLCYIRCSEGEKLWGCHSSDIHNWAESPGASPRHL